MGNENIASQSSEVLCSVLRADRFLLVDVVRYLCSIVLGTAVADVQRATYKVILHIDNEERVRRTNNLRAIKVSGWVDGKREREIIIIINTN